MSVLHFEAHVHLHRRVIMECTSTSTILSVAKNHQLLNLNLIKAKLQEKGYSSEFLNNAETDYRNFLENVASGNMASPTKMADVMWHEHILQTRKYAEDCERLFNGFLHHESEISTYSVSSSIVISAVVHGSGVQAICAPAIAINDETLQIICVPAKNTVQ